MRRDAWATGCRRVLPGAALLMFGPALFGACRGAPAEAPSPREPATHPGCADGRGCPGDAGTPPPPPRLAAPDGAPEGPPIRLLFVGNSYTYVNDLPSVVAALGGATPGAAVTVESVAVGGATLTDHWQKTGARARIEGGGHEVIVLQGQSVEPLFGEGFHESAQLLDDAAAAAGARAVWFATWARRAGDPLFGGALTPASMTTQLEAQYALAARRHRGVVARVGAAWQLAAAEMPEIALHAEDGSHPTAAGSLLAACVLLQAITGETPRIPEPPPLGISSTTARALCALAPRVRCLAHETLCGRACVDTTSDPLHCGGCGAACAGGDPCVAGACGCAPGLTGCARTCVDLQATELDCGACGARCTEAKVCAAGACTCPGARARPVDLADLAARDPGCSDWSGAGTLACNAAARAYCVGLGGCFQSGYGPPSGHAPQAHAVACVAGDVHTTTYAELATLVPTCDGLAERSGAACATAIARHCVARGAASGFGPVAVAGDAVTVTCLPRATVVATTMATLGTFASRCLPHATECSAAAWNFCADRGHPGGFGPLEVVGNDARVVCFDP